MEEMPKGEMREIAQVVIETKNDEGDVKTTTFSYQINSDVRDDEEEE